ncbi:MAG: ECF transporter S component [Lachnospiraceae bacterium]|nr:ECF transporter S component [Lachnospiraceae bacterium]
MMKFTVKKITTLAMLAAMAYIVMAFIRIPLMPAAPFLEYDPKDIFFVIAGFLFGPIESLVIIILVCLIEMVTVSTSGPIGLLMNVIASACFVIPAALIYKKKKNLTFAIIGLASGVLCMTASMVLWNWLISPLYMGVPREVIVPMLPTVFAPFNLIKAGINMALTLIIYKPISTILHKSGILEDKVVSKTVKTETVVTDSEEYEKVEIEKTVSKNEKSSSKKFSPWALIIGVVILAVCIGAIVLIKLNS